MLSQKFRPWGNFPWVLSKLKVIQWDFIGCISTEERCSTTFENVIKSGILNNGYFFEIIDPIFSDEHAQKIKIARDKILKMYKDDKIKIYIRELLQEDIKLYEDIKSLLDNSISSIIIDISCLPKRYFFPLVKLAMQEDRLQNLIITYTVPEKYCSEDLSDDPEPWYPLPFFMPVSFPDEKYEVAIVGTGFMPFSLPKLLKDKHSEILLKLLFPFPPGPPNYQRSWEFVRKIEKHYTLKSNDKILRINSLDLCEAFDHICSATNFGNNKAIFAPYGPKPISLAMCIYASLSNSPVYYTQPKYYNPNYSIGAKENLAYCIKINGKNLYTIDL